jgi:hypothetical protein
MRAVQEKLDSSSVRLEGFTESKHNFKVSMKNSESVYQIPPKVN